MTRKLIALFSAVLLCLNLSAQEATENEHIEKRYTIYFRVNKSDIDRSYMGNARTIETMVEDIRTTLEADGTVPDSLTVYASTSPEGPAALNERLAIQRAQATRDLLVGLFPQFDPAKIKVESRADDWTGVVLALRRDTTATFRDFLLKILTNPTISNKDAAVKRNPAAYASIRDGLFDNMRSASIAISVIRTETNVDEFVADPELFITTGSPMEFPAEGGEGVAAYTKNVEDSTVPAVTSTEDWVQGITPSASSTSFIVAPNTSKNPRSAVLSIENYGKTYQVTVNQAGVDPVLALTSPSPVNFPAEGGEGVITFEKNVEDDIIPVVKSQASHVAVGQTTESQARITVDENTSEEPRESVVEIEYEGKTYVVEVIQEGAKILKPFYMGVKTNMLYDLGIVPNVGVEFYLGKNFSIVGNWMYSWWKSDPKAWYWRTYGGDLAVRYWFGKKANEKPLQGHHVGLYGQIVTYDFEVGGRGYLGDRWSYGAGAEYGYSLPVARRLNIDFTLGVGYLGGEFKEYLPIDGHYVWQVTKHRHWFGPTKAEISLVWLLGRGNENEGKGGKR